MKGFALTCGILISYHISIDWGINIGFSISLRHRLWTGWQRHSARKKLVHIRCPQKRGAPLLWPSDRIRRFQPWNASCFWYLLVSEVGKLQLNLKGRFRGIGVLWCFPYHMNNWCTLCIFRTPFSSLASWLGQQVKCIFVSNDFNG
jgi:hypothetical protein